MDLSYHKGGLSYTLKTCPVARESRAKTQLLRENGDSASPG